MILKRILITILIFGLLGFTVVRVSALWSQQQPEALAPATMLSENISSADWLIRLDDRQRALFDRLNGRLQKNSADYEARLLRGLLYFQAGRLQAAVDELRSLTTQAPKFQLAHLILGDLLLARFDQVASIGDSRLMQKVGAQREEEIEQLRREARARLQGYLALVDGVEVPRALLALSSKTEYALIVDKGKNRLYVFRNLGPGLAPELIDDFYVVLGKKTGDKYQQGDLKTPNGVYFVTNYLPDENLPPLYGAGAFPVNYPNEFDRRQQKTGDGIWLHGTDKSFYSRPPLDSEGCVVLTNEEFSRISRYVKVRRTPVIISEAVEWVSAREWLDLNIEIQATLERWRQNWEQADLDAYLQMYSSKFWSKGHDSHSWGTYKKQVFAGKKFQKIDLSDLTLLAYPEVADGQKMLVANFVQSYRSNNYNGDMRKRLYMIKEAGQWKVLYEGRQ